MKRETIQRLPSPTAILVGVPESLATFCTEVLGENGLRVLRVGHAAAAAERIPVVMPQLVLIAATLNPQDLEALTDRCVAVGAQVIQVAEGANQVELGNRLATAAHEALVKALRGF